MKILTMLPILFFLSLAQGADPVVYTVDVIDGTNGDEFNFSSPAETVSLPPNPAGVVVQFRNLTQKTLAIHGEGIIPHQDTSHPLTPACTDSSGHVVPSEHGIYRLDPIFPSDGADLEGSYTIHDVYHPERTIVLNALH